MNSSNIDFALFYPKPLIKKTKVNIVSSPPIEEPSTSPSVDISNVEEIKSVENITYPIEQEIFVNLPSNFFIKSKELDLFKNKLFSIVQDCMMKVII